MSDVFLSYSREDQDKARRFAEALEREGFSVWWDQALNPGQTFDQVTEQALKDARAVVVLWSKHSVQSRWVRSEATQADRMAKLVPVMIEPCDRPILFELSHTIDLAGWHGNAGDSAWRSFVEGLRRTMSEGSAQRPADGATQAQRQGSRLGGHPAMWLVSLALLLLLGLAAWVIHGRTAARAVTAGGSATPAATEGDISLAVLPFANLSADPEQEYFSDGLAEEILNQLAQVRGLRLVGRASSFAFRDDHEDLRSVAAKLGVANLLEGSVRKSGDDLRISTQLIRASDGANLWTKTYARRLQDVFALQEEIAKDVATALSVKLDVSEVKLAEGGTKNVEAYDLYLRANRLQLVEGGSRRAMEAAELLRQAVALDPDFGLAWGMLGNALSEARLAAPPAQLPLLEREMKEATEQNARLMSPDIAGALQRLGMAYQQRNWLEAERAIRQVIERRPLTPRTTWPTLVLIEQLRDTGRIDDAIRLQRQLVRLEPLSLVYSSDLQVMLYGTGRDEEARQEFERGSSLSGLHQRANFFALLPLLAKARLDGEATGVLFRAILAEDNLPNSYFRSLYEVRTDREAMRRIVRKAAADPANALQVQMQVLALLADALGDRESTLDLNEKLARGEPNLFSFWLHPISGMRADPRFRKLVIELKLPEYWRASGKWANFCEPVGAEDFVCR